MAGSARGTLDPKATGTPSSNGAPRRAVVLPSSRLPGPRALVGALLVTASALGLFVAASGSDEDRGTIVTAATDLRVGQRIDADDLALEPGEMPHGSSAFTRAEDLVGRVVLGPIGAGEVVQASTVSDRPRDGVPRREVALTLPRDHVAVGRLRAGDRVDVFVTYDDRTASIVNGAEVVQVIAADEGSLAGAREARLVVAVESEASTAALVHALRTGDVTIVRSTFVDEQPDHEITYLPVPEGEPEAR